MVKPRAIQDGLDTDVEAELSRLPNMPIAQLRLRYRELFRADPPAAFGPDLLRRSIAYRIQEKAYGGLPSSVQRVLDQMIKAFIAKPDGRLVLPRRIKPGSILVRNWKGKSYRVIVMEDGFSFDGRSYSNLSEIAQQITGTRWNGPRFFGLRSSKPADVAPTARRPQLGGGSDYRKLKAVSQQSAKKGRSRNGL